MMMSLICALTIIGTSLPVPDNLIHLLKQHGWGHIEEDSILNKAAQEVTNLVGSAQTEVPPDELGKHLSFILAKYGVSDAQIVPYTTKGQGPMDWAERAPRLIGKFERHLRPTHYGRAKYQAGGTWTETYIFLHRGARLTSEIPLRAESGQIIHVLGELRRGYFEPRLIVKTPQGQFGEGLPKQKQRRFNFELKLNHGEGIYGVELVADSRYGPTVLIQHELHVGVPPPSRPTMRLRPTSETVQVVDLAIRMLSLVNAHRVAHDLNPLTQNKVLSQLAENHAQEMNAARRLTHASPTTGTLMTRVRRLGLNPHMVAENLAEARDEKAAFHAFLESPGHARNLLIPELTDIGIGVSGRYFAVTMCQFATASTPPGRIE